MKKVAELSTSLGQLVLKQSYPENIFINEKAKGSPSFKNLVSSEKPKCVVMAPLIELSKLIDKIANRS